MPRMQANPKIPTLPPHPVAERPEGSDGDDYDDSPLFNLSQDIVVDVRIVQMHPGGDTLEMSIISEVVALDC
jgi:hypothetical protein